MSEISDVLESDKRVWTLEDTENIVFPDGVGATDIERFLNVLIGDKYLLHGSTEYIEENIKSNASATDNAGIALMYALHTNKNYSIRISGINRGWSPSEDSSGLKLRLEYEVKPEFIDITLVNGFENAIKRLTDESMKPLGYVYLVKKDEFEIYNQELREFRSNKQTQFLKCFEVRREWFKGEVYGSLVLTHKVSK